jgi:three-Cys-motif partner protein
LEQLRAEFSDLSDDIEIYQGEANKFIQELCKRNWKQHRAVMFLDPFGMQVEWETIAAIAATRAIDMWLLFPLGIGVNRLLTKSGHIPKAWRRRLDLLLGSNEWFAQFYEVQRQNDLFGHEERLVKRSLGEIGQYFKSRLQTVFAGVAEPGFLLNSVNCPLYLLCFAVGNPKGAKPALGIANHLLKELQKWP